MCTTCLPCFQVMDLSKPSTTMTPGVLVMPIEVCCAVILEQFSQSFIASRFKLTVDCFWNICFMFICGIVILVKSLSEMMCSELHERVDFVICLGGDGVILHASNLFRNAIPPVVSFNLGSLGFLTAHPVCLLIFPTVFCAN